MKPDTPRLDDGSSSPAGGIHRRGFVTGSFGLATCLLAGDTVGVAGAGESGARRPLKVTDVDVTMFTWPVTRGVAHDGTARGAEVELGLLRVRADDGTEGYSFLGGHRMSGDRWAADLLSFLKPVVMGSNPLDIGRHWRTMSDRGGFLLPVVIAAMDIALWDLAGKVAGLPIHRMLGTCRDRVPANASSPPFKPVEHCVAEALHYRSLGWQSYKIHGHKDPDKDIEICRAVRKAVGDGMVLMLDSMWAYGHEDALRVGRAIEDLDFRWYEDPLPKEDVYGSARLREKLDIPLMSTELAHGGLSGMQAYILLDATDILRGDVALKGGLTALVKIAHLAEAFGMNCEVHTAGNAINNVANLNVTMAIDNCDYFEVLLPHDPGAYGLMGDIVVDEEGFVHAPEAPGLGYEIDWDLVKDRTTRVLK
jgi:L-alanine-DL-glutamate epimerase-like enolase superfamily enzyme